MKIAVITGASGGIGIEITKEFIKNGYFVVAQYNKNKSALDKLYNELEADNLSDYLFSVQSDFASLEAVEEFSKKIFNNFKHVDAFISVSGVDLYKMLEDTSTKELVDLMNINLNSSYILTREIVKSMSERKSGKIVYISSIWGNTGASMETAYSASKAGLIGLTKALAKEVALSGVNVNCVCPGVIDTPMNDGYTAEEKEDIRASIPLGRFGTGEEIAKLVSFLCSDQASYITGQIITSDGGFTL